MAQTWLRNRLISGNCQAEKLKEEEDWILLLLIIPCQLGEASWSILLPQKKNLGKKVYSLYNIFFFSFLCIVNFLDMAKKLAEFRKLQKRGRAVD